MTSRTSGGVTVTPVWDKAGNLTSDGSRTYSWDARGRLTGISGVATYLYDAEGRRIKTTPTTGSAASVVYDDVDVVQEQLAGVASANLLNGPGIDEHLTRTTTGTGAATSTLLTDALGSSVALASSAGTIAALYGYTPYGAAGVTGTANSNPYQFTGAPQDGSGLIQLRARYYNPVWGRFISEDPIGLAGGINRYAYADGNPVEIIDPFGLDGVRASKVLGAGGKVQDGMTNMARGILKAGGKAAAAETAEHLLGPLGYVLAGAGEIVEAGNGMNEGMPADVAIIMGYTKFAGGFVGGSLGATGGFALGAFAGFGVGDIVTIPAFGVAGGLAGSNFGESVGGAVGSYYASSRGYHVSE